MSDDETMTIVRLLPRENSKLSALALHLLWAFSSVGLSAKPSICPRAANLQRLVEEQGSVLSQLPESP